MADKNAIVIGTGVGGAGVAALLAGGAFKVTVFERNEFPGGKTAMYEREGCRVDANVHTSPRGACGPIGQLARKLDADLELRDLGPWRLTVGSRSTRLPLAFTRPLALAKIALVVRPNPLSMLGAFRLFRKVLGIKTMDDLIPYYGKPVSGFIDGFTRDQRLLTFFNVIGGMMFVIPSTEASTAEFLWALSWWARDAAVAYPRGGYGRVPSSFIEVCERRGGTVRLSEPVRRIVAEEGRVTGVETDQGFYPADVVISNAGMKKTVELAGPDHFEAAYVERVGGLRDSLGAVTYKCALDCQPMETALMLYVPDGWTYEDYWAAIDDGRVPADVPLYILQPTVIDPDLAPAGQHLLLACAPVPASLEYSDLARAVADVVVDRLGKLFPGMRDHLLWEHKTDLEYIAKLGGRGAGEAIGLAQSYDQDGPNKPDPRTPIEGLYVVGVDAGGMGIGTERAADSAMKVFDIVVEDTGPRSKRR
ncbi:MAG: phytoene desaturase family protein [Candidatus Geothermincolia bacterium]